MHVTAIIAAGLERFTEATLCDADDLREELDLIRKQGLCGQPWRMAPGHLRHWRPVLGSDQRPAGPISISVPAFRFLDENLPRHAGLLVESAREITKSLP